MTFQSTKKPGVSDTGLPNVNRFAVRIKQNVYANLTSKIDWFRFLITLPDAIQMALVTARIPMNLIATP